MKIIQDILPYLAAFIVGWAAASIMMGPEVEYITTEPERIVERVTEVRVDTVIVPKIVERENVVIVDRSEGESVCIDRVEKAAGANTAVVTRFFDPRISAFIEKPVVIPPRDGFFYGLSATYTTDGRIDVGGFAGRTFMNRKLEVEAFGSALGIGARIRLRRFK
ncbi:MAG: hypothetical protein KatS3mg104_2976 [Phycisphaerae bacterium]|nr:MAG: hypothetical protein KatS3mg104_2976 [Phycisphaerae bacterium]